MYSLCSSLTSLRSGNDIVTVQHGRNGVSLDRSWVVVGTAIDVLDHHWVEACRVELGFVRGKSAVGKECTHAADGARLLLSFSNDLDGTKTLEVSNRLQKYRK